MSLSRRHFLSALGASAAASAAALAQPGLAESTAMPSMPPRRLKRVGLELFSVRDQMAKDPDGTLAHVAKMGYDDVELLWSFGNFGRSAAQVREALDRNGLKAPSAHMNAATIFVGWERSLEVAHRLGHEYLIVPSFTPETDNTLDAWREWADHFNKAGAAARRANIWLAFHNEPDHMRPIGGSVPYDVFVERSDPSVVRLQLDVGNMAMGGGDPLAYLRRFRNRYWSFHLKDVLRDRSRDTEMGAGTLDFKKLLAEVPDLDAKPCYVEQEGASDPMASARKNVEYLKRLEF
jgi:sugar phosphate isomerase/epimerase